MALPLNRQQKRAVNSQGVVLAGSGRNRLGLAGALFQVQTRQLPLPGHGSAETSRPVETNYAAGADLSWGGQLPSHGYPTHRVGASNSPVSSLTIARWTGVGTCPRPATQSPSPGTSETQEQAQGRKNSWVALVSLSPTSCRPAVACPFGTVLAILP